MQRKLVLEILISKCKNSQLQYTFSLVDEKIPITHVDFTRKLPRVISIYIMSFLDPRSLCRCAQVCWFWKYLSELDQIWMPKCFKFGWILPFVPTPFEQGVWKRHYLECVKGLQYVRPKVRSFLYFIFKTFDNINLIKKNSSKYNFLKVVSHTKEVLSAIFSSFKIHYFSNQTVSSRIPKVHSSR